jgi:hypothetical protein
MNRPQAVMRVEILLLLIGIAVLLPQLGGSSRSESLSGARGVYDQAVLQYAKLRLWGDFLEQRQQTLQPHRLPEPSWAEYRVYLNACGLRRRGDAITLYVLPPLDPSAAIDRIRVGLRTAHDPLILEVQVPGPRSHEQRIGQLLVLRGPNGTMQCRIEPSRGLPLWSFWPLRPEPLLP